MAGGKLLAFFAHPDDEAFACAGTLAAAVDRGLGVELICATRGESGRARDGVAGDLAARRSAELAASCEAIGCAAPLQLALPDGALDASLDELTRRLDVELDALRPDAVITFGTDGAYGHRDHIACTEALARLDLSSAILHVVFPDGLLDELRRVLKRSRVPLTETSKPAEADYVVDIRGHAERKLAALAAHRSQLDAGDPHSFLMPGIVDRLLVEERFAHAGGPPLAGAVAELFETLR